MKTKLSNFNNEFIININSNITLIVVYKSTSGCEDQPSDWRQIIKIRDHNSVL